MTANEIKTLTEENTNLRAIYDEVTHRLKCFVIVPPSISWTAWENESKEIRQQLTMRRSTAIPSLWVADPGAPVLDPTPSIAIVYDPRIKGFLPALNCSISRIMPFSVALAEAKNAAAEASIFYEQKNQIPTTSDLDGYDGLIFVGKAYGNKAAGVQSILARFNSTC